MSAFRSITPSEATGLNRQLSNGLQRKLGLVRTWRRSWLLRLSRLRHTSALPPP